MELALTCVGWIALVFICVYCFTSIFFRLERSVVHRTINATIVLLCYGIETVLRIITNNPTFILSILLVLLWGWNLFSSIRLLICVNKLKKEIEEILKLMEKDQP